MGVRRFSFIFLSLLVLSFPVLANDDLIEKQEFLNVTIGGHRVRLEGMTVKRADASGRLPIALITHGKPGTYGTMLEQHTSGMLPQARDLAYRGWLAAIVVRRGFGASDGPMPSPVGCRSGTLLERFAADADDLQAALDVIAKRSDVDPTHVIAIGESAGGAAVTALSARNPKGLVGVVNVSGGLHFDICDKDDALVAAFKTYGAESRVPSLWLYARNDSLFGPALVDRMHAAFLNGGADVKLVMLDPIGRDGHSIFDSTYGRDAWLPELDAFLRFHDLPTWPFRDADSLVLKLKSKDKYLGFIQQYVSGPAIKALAQSRDSGALGRAYGFDTLDGARKSAIESCENDAPTESCDVVMENNRWVGPSESVSGSAQADVFSGPATVKAQ
jgi:dienelactone hydrolase